MMLFSLTIAVATAADPWGRPTHPRVVTKPPVEWSDLYSETAIFRLWWDDDGLPATIEVQGKKKWKTLTKEGTPGWISPPLPKDSIFRITLEGATRSSPLLFNTAAISPTMLADLSVDKGATFGSNNLKSITIY